MYNTSQADSQNDLQNIISYIESNMLTERTHLRSHEVIFFRVFFTTLF